MITKTDCADWINANINTRLTADEITMLRNSIENHVAKDILVDSLIHLLGDVSLLVEIRDAN